MAWQRGRVLALAGLAWLGAPSVATAGADQAALHGPGGGRIDALPRDRISEDEHARIRQEIERNVARLRAEGKLGAGRQAGVLLGWPLRAVGDLSVFGFHGISNFVDQDEDFPDRLLDYQCGQRTYDLSDGYNHRGTDIFLWPFPWNRMEADEIEIVAAAAGTIVYKEDGHFDHSCTLNNEPWNAVYVMHADGSVAWYGHMKQGSPTPKAIGSAVAAGEYLGVVGSSGSSTGPHLHLEVYDDLGNLIDPYQGPCNALNPDSWWIEQRPYYDSAVNQITTGTAAPVLASCPDPDTSNAQSVFAPGSRIYFTTYYRDQLQNQVSQYRIYRPDGSIYASWSHSSPATHYAASYWWWWVDFPASVPTGTWWFDVFYEGRSYRQYFAIGTDFAAGSLDSAGQLRVEPDPGGGLRLSWGGSCRISDNDYEIYEGRLGEYYSHVRRECSTGGQTSWTLLPAPFDSYYLVAPRNAAHEGSYGEDAAGIPRPPAPDACLPLVADPCP